ncbi:MAG: VWA domain-containing protein [Candidatus Adiutrix sp.]|jgi:uncharacterized protein YegL|nr:VWA domain-containing protein [Candidatus Adiutrix sp.]
MLRRLPVYLLLDCSESMAGPPLEAVENGVATMLAALKRNPHALETVFMSVITFDAKARQEFPLTEIAAMAPPRLSIRPGTAMGAALKLLAAAIKREVVKTTEKQKGDYRPLVFIITDGRPTDEWREAARRLRESRPALASIYAIGCGDDVDFAVLKEAADVSIHMSALSTDSFAKLFVWLSASVQSMSVSAADKISLEKIPLGEGLALVEAGAAPPPAARPRLYFHARCRKTRRHYLMIYKYEPAGEVYMAQAGHALPDDFFAEGTLAAPDVSSDLLYGETVCPHCGAAAWAQCGFCRHLFCLPEDFDEPALVCPVCETRLTRGRGDAFDVSGSAG